LVRRARTRGPDPRDPELASLHRIRERALANGAVSAALPRTYAPIF